MITEDRVLYSEFEVSLLMDIVQRIKNTSPGYGRVMEINVSIYDFIRRMYSDGSTYQWDRDDDFEKLSKIRNYTDKILDDIDNGCGIEDVPFKINPFSERRVVRKEIMDSIITRTSEVLLHEFRHYLSNERVGTEA